MLQKVIDSEHVLDGIRVEFSAEGDFRMYRTKGVVLAYGTMKDDKGSFRWWDHAGLNSDEVNRFREIVRRLYKNVIEYYKKRFEQGTQETTQETWRLQ